MATFCFVSYEIHPTGHGGAGVLIRHAIERLLSAGHRILLLLDIPAKEFGRFESRDSRDLPHRANLRCFRVDELCSDFRFDRGEIPNLFLWKSLRFEHALGRVVGDEHVDFVEFFEYCGAGYYAMTRALFDPERASVHVGLRTHGAIELLDRAQGVTKVDGERHLLYALERGVLAFAETVLVPSKTIAEAHYLPRYQIDSEAIVESPPPVVPFAPRRARPDPRSILFIGRMSRLKGADAFVQAGVELLERGGGGSSLRFVLIGPDTTEGSNGESFEQELRDRIPDRHRDRFEFAGVLPRDDIVGRLEDAMFAVFPSRFESFCLALHEVYSAGVPVIANSIPAFASVLRDAENALLYDGSVEGLTAAMERLAGDDSLRAKLTRPYPIAPFPLGSFYDQPDAHRRPPEVPRPVEVLALIWAPAGSGATEVAATRKAVRAQLRAGDDLATVAEGDGGDGERVSFLGSSSRARAERGSPRGLIRTRDAVWLLKAGDLPAPDYLHQCRGALSRHAALGFAGTWCRDARGKIEALTYDVAPERLPFERGTRLSRALIRCERGRPLADLFDPRFGALGEVALLWEAGQRWGPGCLLPEVRVECADSAYEAPEAASLARLLESPVGIFYAERLEAWAEEGARLATRRSPSIWRRLADRLGRILRAGLWSQGRRGP